MKFPRGRTLWISALLFILLGAAALTAVPKWLLDHWVPDGTLEEHKQLLGSAAQIVLFGLGGIIAVVGVGLSLARHGQSLVEAEAQQAREDTRRSEFNEQMTAERNRERARRKEAKAQRQIELERDLRGRFVSAVDLLSASDAVKRTAGLHALAALGDDWLAFGNENELQVCIDVMCGYLRSAVSEDERTPAEASVRLTGYELIRDHLQQADENAPSPWEGRRFPLAQAPLWFTVHLDAVTLSEGTLIDLTGAELTGRARLQCNGLTIRTGGRLRLRGAHLVGRSAVRLDNLTIEHGGRAEFDATTLGDNASIVAFHGAIHDEGVLSFDFTRFTDSARMLLRDLEVESSGRISGAGAFVRGEGQVWLDRLHVRENGHIRLTNFRAQETSQLRLSGVHVTGGRVTLLNAHLVDEAKAVLIGCRFRSAKSLDLTSATTEDHAFFGVPHTKIGTDALTLPNRDIVGYPETTQPSGARIHNDAVVTT